MVLIDIEPLKFKDDALFAFKTIRRYVKYNQVVC